MAWSILIVAVLSAGSGTLFSVRPTESASEPTGKMQNCTHMLFLQVPILLPQGSIIVPVASTLVVNEITFILLVFIRFDNMFSWGLALRGEMIYNPFTPPIFWHFDMKWWRSECCSWNLKIRSRKGLHLSLWIREVWVLSNFSKNSPVYLLASERCLTVSGLFDWSQLPSLCDIYVCPRNETL